MLGRRQPHALQFLLTTNLVITRYSHRPDAAAKCGLAKELLTIVEDFPLQELPLNPSETQKVVIA